MFKSIILKLVWGFVIKKLAKYGVDTDWALVKENFYERIKNAKIIPDFIEDEISMLVGKAIDVVASIMQSKEFLSEMVEAVKAKDIKKALGMLKQAILDKYLPHRDLAMNEDESLLMAVESAVV